MPFIDTKVTMKLSDSQKENLKAKLGKAISVMNKSETYLMVGILDGYDLFLGGKKLEKDFEKEIGIKTEDFPDYDYFFNILFNLGIYANVERFDLNNYKKYNSIDEAMDNGKFRIELYDDGQKDLLRKYLQKALTYDDESKKYYNVKDKADWILIWWKK